MPKKISSVVLVSLVILAFSGCSTVPTGGGSSKSIYLRGTTYYPLVPLCEQRAIAWQYDTTTQKILLQRDTHKVAARVGDALVLVDGRLITLKNPLDLYNGAIIVPESFKAQIIESLFKDAVALTSRACPLPRFKKIVIDAGHGGKDPGASGRSGIREKEINLDIARRLADILTRHGVEVVMTRSTDVFIPLPERHEIANKAMADLFVSIHTNASRTRSLNGFETYYVCPSVSDARRAEVAALQSPLQFPATAFADDSLNLKTTVWDLMLTSCRAESISLGRSICLSAEQSLGVKILGVKSARFEVLKGALMPAVLVEVGFISYGPEERKLGNSFYRQTVAEAIASGILGYRQAAI
jgi:N-acetylmuramoyl-L-alanine amidase